MKIFLRLGSSGFIAWEARVQRVRTENALKKTCAPFYYRFIMQAGKTTHRVLTLDHRAGNRHFGYICLSVWPIPGQKGSKG